MAALCSGSAPADHLRLSAFALFLMVPAVAELFLMVPAVAELHLKVPAFACALRPCPRVLDVLAIRALLRLTDCAVVAAWLPGFG